MKTAIIYAEPAEQPTYTYETLGKRMKTATLHCDVPFGKPLKMVGVYYRNNCLAEYNTLEEAKAWAKRNGFTHARYSGTFSGKEQPKAGPL